MRSIKKDAEQLVRDMAKLDPGTQLDKMVESTAAFGRKRVEQDEPINSLMAMFPDGVGFRRLACTNAEEKQEAFGQAANYLAQRDAHLALLITDVWVSKGKGRPSLDPARSEALIVWAITPDGRVVYALCAPYERIGRHIKWDSVDAGPVNYVQNFLRPWVMTINGETCGHIISTKADGDNFRVFPFLTDKEEG